MAFTYPRGLVLNDVYSTHVKKVSFISVPVVFEKENFEDTHSIFTSINLPFKRYRDLRLDNINPLYQIYFVPTLIQILFSSFIEEV